MWCTNPWNEGMAARASMVGYCVGWHSGMGVAIVGGISVHCKTHLQVPDSRVRAWSQQSCLRRDKIQYFGKVLQNSPLAVHKMQLNRAILTMILPCRYLSWVTRNRNYLISAQNRSYSES